MNILLLGTADRGGGAEKVALDLLTTYQALGHDARLLVRYKRTDTPGVREVDIYAHTAPWAPASAALERVATQLPQFRGKHRLTDLLRASAWPQRLIDRASGREDFNYPYAHQITVDDDWTPDFVHAHNLHGDFFDLRALTTISQHVPLIWTLHDTWALTGHCGYFIDCGRWTHGCGQCPDLRRPPAIARDATAENWQRKRQIYAQSRLAVATPSRWLMSCVDESMLKPWQQQVIPYGVDKKVFRPADQREARAELGLPQDAFIALAIAFVATTTNPYKDISTIRNATDEVMRQSLPGDMLLVCVGKTTEAGQNPRIHYTGYIADPAVTARYYQAADVLLHAANADNFPCVVLEALACGTPVIATAVGGLPEQISDGVTGHLVPRGDSSAMASHILGLMTDKERLLALRRSTLERADRIPSLEQHARTYLGWANELSHAYEGVAALAAD